MFIHKALNTKKIYKFTYSQSFKKLFRGTFLSKVFPIPMNSELNFFCNCGCIAFKISCPFSLRNKFVASTVTQEMRNFIVQ